MAGKFSNEVIEALKAGLAELKALEPVAKDYILAWDNGLGVKFRQPMKPVAVTIQAAEIVAYEDMPEEAFAYVPQVLNGHGEQAKLVLQKVAVQAEIKKLEKMIEEHA
jgi:hypothetical protein